MPKTSQDVSSVSPARGRFVRPTHPSGLHPRPQGRCLKRPVASTTVCEHVPRPETQPCGVDFNLFLSSRKTDEAQRMMDRAKLHLRLCGFTVPGFEDVEPCCAISWSVMFSGQLSRLRTSVPAFLIELITTPLCLGVGSTRSVAYVAAKSADLQ